MDLFEERAKSHKLRSELETDFVINANGAAFEEYSPMANLSGGMSTPELVDPSNTGKSIGRAVVGGVQDAVKGIVSTSDDIGQFIDSKLGSLGYINYDENGFSFSRDKPQDMPNMDDAFSQGLRNAGIEVPQGDGVMENLGRGLVQFAAGMGVAPIKGVSLLANMGRGAFADALFDPEGGNLSTLINEAGFGNVVTEFLDSKVGKDAEADERLTGRLKQALEGAGLGIPIDLAVGAFRAARSDEGLAATIKSKLQAVGERLNQPGEMPDVGMNAGQMFQGSEISEIEKKRLELEVLDETVKLAKQSFLDLPEDKDRFAEYQRLAKQRTEMKDALAVAKAQAEDNLKQVKAPTENSSGIIAFHGSGADFDEFKIDKIGTGEGAQAFGYGLYFTDSEDIAKFYRNAVGAGNEVTYKGKKVQDLDDDNASYEENLAHMVGQQNSSFDKKRVIENEIARIRKNLSGIEQSIKDFEQNSQAYPLKFFGLEIDMPRAIEIREDFKVKLDDALAVEKNIETIKTNPRGKVYQVSLAPKPNELIDYDKSFDEQSEFVQNAILKVLDEIDIDDAFNLGIDFFSPPYNGNTDMALRDAKKSMLENFTTVRFLNDWSVLRGAENSGETLLEKHGVKGIQYKANQGVGARNVPETGAKNYVIFDDKMISILKKYGIVGPVAISAAGLEKSTTTDGEDS